MLLLPLEEATGFLKDVRLLATAIGAEQAFIDAKLHDIPNTIKGASVAISRMGVRFFNIHASAGPEAIKAAVVNRGHSQVLGVTVLTSIDSETCVSIFGGQPKEKVLDFVKLLANAGADGVICSPQELQIIRDDVVFNDLLLVTPGVRPEWAAAGDQKRIMTPAEAIKAGADYLVIGRPILKPPKEIGSPVEAAKRIAEEIASAVA